jgi:hypothetical protein
MERLQGVMHTPQTGVRVSALSRYSGMNTPPFRSSRFKSLRRAKMIMIVPDERSECLRFEHVTSPRLERAIADLGIAIVTTRRGIAGERRWFQCPGEACERHCSTLYLAEEGLVCSRCAGLSDEKSERHLRQQSTKVNAHVLGPY